ncbi:MAG: hypothetical protein HY820_43895 [Acidobacteria bacterium]|nr:hypothetical protein [Acidobacteriota bacterium]
MTKLNLSDVFVLTSNRPGVAFFEKPLHRSAAFIAESVFLLIALGAAVVVYWKSGQYLAWDIKGWIGFAWVSLLTIWIRVVRDWRRIRSLTLTPEEKQPGTATYVALEVAAVHMTLALELMPFATAMLILALGNAVKDVVSR